MGKTTISKSGFLFEPIVLHEFGKTLPYLESYSKVSDLLGSVAAIFLDLSQHFH